MRQDKRLCNSHMSKEGSIINMSYPNQAAQQYIGYVQPKTGRPPIRIRCPKKSRQEEEETEEEKEEFIHNFKC